MPMPFAINARDFDFDSGGIRLCGTLQAPASNPPVGSVLLLSGSGPQDRDETVAGKKCFAVLSEALAGWGYQVLRWDDRGVGRSGGDYLASTASELIGDVANAMSALEKETGMHRHILLGHSQGTLIAASVAARNSADVSHLVLLAGMAVPGRQGLLDQHVNICRADCWSDEDIEYSLAQKAHIFDLLEAAQADIDAGEPEGEALECLKPMLSKTLLGDTQIEDLSTDESAELDLIVEDLLEWEFRFLLRCDPADDLGKVRCPVLAICGDRDSQVEASSNLARIKEVCTNGLAASVETHVVPNCNHLFQKATTAALSDYESLGPPMTGSALSIIRKWLAEKSD